MTHSNPTEFHPRGQAVLVKPYKTEMRDGVIALPENVRARTQMLEQRAVVVEIGPEAWKDEGGPRAAVGEHVIVSAMAGHMVQSARDGLAYRLINARDIFCGLDEESEHV